MALLLFCSILLGVGIHHVVATGTCSSTGYSANYGPVPTCPAGTGWWFAFVFGGIIGGLIGALMAGSLALVFGGIFSAIGFGALTIILDAHAQSGAKIFGGIFGGCFALVGVVSVYFVIRGAVTSSARSRVAGRAEPSAGVTTAAPAAASRTAAWKPTAWRPTTRWRQTTSAATPMPMPAATMLPTGTTATTQPTPLGLLAGLEAAKRTAAAHSGDAGQTVEELGKLAELHAQGALTDDEFASAKKRLLGPS